MSSSNETPAGNEENSEILAMAEEQRNNLFNQLKKKKTVNVVFAKRAKQRGQRPKFFFYSEDHEDLIICASVKKVKGGMCYKASLSAKDIKRKSPWFVGINQEIKKYFYGDGALPSQTSNLFNSIKIFLGETKRDGIITLAPPNAFENLSWSQETNDTTSTSQEQEGTISIQMKPSVDVVSADPSYLNITVVYGSNICMSMKQIAEEEFQITINYPLSIYQAFCIACSLM